MLLVVISKGNLLRYAKYCVLGMVASAILVFVYLSCLAGPLWHALNGDSVHVADQRVTVPKGYARLFVRDAFFTFDFGAPILRKDRYGAIYVFAHKMPDNMTEVNIENAVVSTANSEGYRLVVRRQVPSASGISYCFQFADSSHPTMVAVR